MYAAGFGSASSSQALCLHQQVLLVCPACLVALILHFAATCVLADALLLSAGSTSLLCPQALQVNLRILLAQMMGWVRTVQGRLKAALTPLHRVCQTVLALLRSWCVIPMNSGILTAKVMTVKIKHVAYKEMTEQGQLAFHLTERTILSLLVFLEAMSVLLFILCFILNIHCIMYLNAYLYLWFIALLLLHDIGCWL